MHSQASLLSSASFGSDQHNLVWGGRSTDQEWTDIRERNQIEKKKEKGKKKKKKGWVENDNDFLNQKIIPAEENLGDCNNEHKQLILYCP